MKIMRGVFFIGLLLFGCQKTEEGALDFGDMEESEEEKVEWNLPLEVVLEEQGFLEVPILFDRKMYGESLK
jgi:hypothetical protein